MPNPRKGESQEHYVHRAVPEILRDGTTDDPKQAVAIAFSMYRQRRRTARAKSMMGWMANYWNVPPQAAASPEFTHGHQEGSAG